MLRLGEMLGNLNISLCLSSSIQGLVLRFTSNHWSLEDIEAHEEYILGFHSNQIGSSLALIMLVNYSYFALIMLVNYSYFTLLNF